MTFFSIQERRDLFIKGQTPGERLPMEDVTYGHYFLVPINDCFDRKPKENLSCFIDS
jgi:hypothetical protein